MHTHTPLHPPSPHTRTRFQAPIEVYGSGSDVGPELVECFPCVTNQQLVNRTCTDIELPSVEVLNTGILSM